MAAERACPKCQESNPTSASHCLVCGTSLGRAKRKIKTPLSSPPPSRALNVLLAFLVGVLVNSIGTRPFVSSYENNSLGSNMAIGYTYLMMGPGIGVATIVAAIANMRSSALNAAIAGAIAGAITAFRMFPSLPIIGAAIGLGAVLGGLVGAVVGFFVKRYSLATRSVLEVDGSTVINVALVAAVIQGVLYVGMPLVFSGTVAWAFSSSWSPLIVAIAASVLYVCLPDHRVNTLEGMVGGGATSFATAVFSAVLVGLFNIVFTEHTFSIIWVLFISSSIPGTIAGIIGGGVTTVVVNAIKSRQATP